MKWPRTAQEYTYWALTRSTDTWHDWRIQLLASSRKEQYLMRLRLLRFVRDTVIHFPDYISTRPMMIFGVPYDQELEVHVLGQQVAQMKRETLVRISNKDYKLNPKRDFR